MGMISSPGGRNSPVDRNKNLIPESFIAEVNERADILAIIGDRVKLKKSGVNNWLGLCPFHSEKGPSFTVTPQKGMYHCFGCGVTGSALTFLVEHDGIPFREAVKELAMKSGLALPEALQDSEEAKAQAAQAYVETAPHFDAMNLAAKFFRHVLAHDDAGKAYLRTRGVKPASATKYLIGCAPDEWRGLQEAFPDYKTNKFILEAGLVKDKERESDGVKNRYDMFRNRLIFPVRDMRGRICAFGGRTLSEVTQGNPKYLNSPDSPIFNKSEMLFGLYEAKESIRQKKCVIVVEGYLDVIMMAQCGVQNCVASMGTSATDAHIEKLLTQTDLIVFSFDGDPAGRKAAWRAMNNCMKVVQDQHDLRFLILPEGKDPDDLAREEGAEAFEERVRKAPSLSEFLIGELRSKHNELATAEDRARFAVDGTAIASRLGYTTKLRRILLKRIADEAQTPGSVIRSLQATSSRRAARSDMWGTILAAARVAPHEAIAERDMIVSIVDTDDAKEALFAEALAAIEEPSAESVLDKSSAQYLVARDTIHNAVNMITEYRLKQVQEQAKLQLQSGEIDEAQYMRIAMSMADI